MDKNWGGKENALVRLPPETKSSSPKSQANSTQSQSLMSLDIFFGPKHPRLSQSHTHTVPRHFTFYSPRRSGQKTSVTVCPTWPVYHCLYFMEKGDISLKIVPCLTGFSNIFHFSCKKKAPHKPSRVSPPAHAGSIATGSQPPVSPRSRQIHCGDCKDAETYLAEIAREN